MSGGMIRYRQGADFERRVRRALEAAGWDTSRSAGSHDDADIIAVGPKPEAKGIRARVVLLQCRRAGKTSPAERAEWTHRWRQRVEFYVVRRRGTRNSQIVVRDLFNWLQGWERLDDVL